MPFSVAGSRLKSKESIESNDCAYVCMSCARTIRNSQHRTGKMPGVDDSIVGSLCDAARPTFLFGCTPPSELISEDDAIEIARKFAERGRVLAVDGYIVCELLARAVAAPAAPKCARGPGKHFFAHTSVAPTCHFLRRVQSHHCNVPPSCPGRRRRAG